MDNTYNNTDYHSNNTKSINADYSALTEKIKTNPKVPEFKVNERLTITKYKNAFSKSFNEKWSTEIFFY